MTSPPSPTQMPLDTVICPTPEKPMALTPPVKLVLMSWPPVSQTAPVAFTEFPTESHEDNSLGPPATVSVPCEPVPLPKFTSAANHMPLDSVSWPTPLLPMYVDALPTSNWPLAIVTEPVMVELTPTTRFEDNATVPPAIVNAVGKPKMPCMSVSTVLVGTLSVKRPGPVSVPPNVLVPLIMTSVLAETQPRLLEKLTESCAMVSVLPPRVMGPAPSLFVSVMTACPLKKASVLLVGGEASPPNVTKFALAALFVTVMSAL